MKKVIFTGLVSVALSATLAEAKFFLGLEGEYSISSTYDTRQVGNGNISWGNRGFDGGPQYPFYQSWNAGINLGTEHLFNDYIGLRWLFGINYGQFVKNFDGLHNINFQLGIDGIFNFVNTGSFSFGLFAGLGARLDFIFNPVNSDLVNGVYNTALLGRLGLTFGLGEHSRIDLGVGVPFMTINLKGPAESFYYSPLRFNVGYKFLF